jgi:hypothetical protein
MCIVLSLKLFLSKCQGAFCELFWQFFIFVVRRHVLSFEDLCHKVFLLMFLTQAMSEMNDKKVPSCVYWYEWLCLCHFIIVIFLMKNCVEDKAEGKISPKMQFPLISFYARNCFVILFPSFPFIFQMIFRDEDENWAMKANKRRQRKMFIQFLLFIFIK